MLLKPPYLAFAFFCERVLHEQDGVLTPIRIVDRLLVNHMPASKSPVPTALHSITLVVGLKAGNYKGKGKIRIKGAAPSGKSVTRKPIETEVELTGADSGANFIAILGLSFREVGTYWFDIYFNDRMLARTPLSVSVFSPQMPIARMTAEKKRIRAPRKA
jgi:hypothetical protein